MTSLERPKTACTRPHARLPSQQPQRPKCLSTPGSPAASTRARVCTGRAWAPGLGIAALETALSATGRADSSDLHQAETRSSLNLIETVEPLQDWRGRACETVLPP